MSEESTANKLAVKLRGYAKKYQDPLAFDLAMSADKLETLQATIAEQGAEIAMLYEVRDVMARKIEALEQKPKLTLLFDHHDDLNELLNYDCIEQSEDCSNEWIPCKDGKPHRSFVLAIDHPTREAAPLLKALEQSEWVSVETEPEDNKLVDMWHEDFVCEDSNPEGIRQGFLIHNEHWYSCKWVQHQDCYETSYDQPQKWKPITPPAEVEAMVVDGMLLGSKEMNDYRRGYESALQNKDTVSIGRNLAEQFRKYAAHQITNATDASSLGVWVRADTELKQALEASNE